MIWSVPFLRISTHTPLARRDDRGVDVARAVLISTHTPLARRDIYGNKAVQFFPNFYSHASCEARPLRREQHDLRIIFLLTRLLRGATTSAPQGRDKQTFLLTRLLRGATTNPAQIQVNLNISTHTPLARRDALVLANLYVISNFYSHASCEARPGCIGGY